MWGFGVSTRGLAAMLSGLDALGLDVDAVCTKAKLDRTLLDDPDRYLFPIAAFRLWRAAIELDGHEDLGVRAGAAVPFGSFEVFDYLLSSAPDLEEVLHRAARYFALGTTMLRWEVDDEPGGAVAMRFRAVIPAPMLPPVLRDFGVSALVRRAFMLTGSATPDVVELAGRPLASRERYRELFGSRVELRADRNRVVFPAETRKLPVLRYDAALSRLLKRHADRLLQSVPRPEFDETVRRVITTLIEHGEPSVATVAAELGVSARTLQRRLTEANTSLSETIDDVRREMAIALLEERSLSISEVGLLLGYSEPSSFTRAFKRWTGRTPSAQRKTLRSGER